MHCVGGTGQPVSSMTWTGFFEANLDGLFQTSLLLVADHQEAERALCKAIDVLDVSEPPCQAAAASIERQIVLNSLSIDEPSSSTSVASARGMLQPDLRPVLALPCAPRACFVLLILLGYATSTCAQILGIEEQAVRMLLHSALLQLRAAVITGHHDENLCK